MGDTFRKRCLIGICLSVLVLVSYWGVVGNGFINYDDPVYVTENRHVQGGLGLGGVIWAYSATEASNWHPLTWLSLMLDRELFGMNPGGYHWTNVVLHLLGVLFLFLALDRMTGVLWCSGLVAGLFAVHPLHVESVAWVAERKDVLSGLFWMLGMWSYARYAERPGVVRYGWVVLFFVLGLMSKPMVVTFPFVLLLLDWWPLGRMGSWGRGLVRLVWEKIPLFLLSAAGSVVTFLVQKEGVAPLGVLPFADRLVNAVVSYGQYLVKMLFPFNLAVFYPHPGGWPMGEFALSFLLILLVTVFVIMQVGRRPYFLVGWLWYLGTLVPVIGIVQVGSQAMADRYAYLPLIGVYLMAVWGFRDLLLDCPWRRVVWGVVSGGVLGVLVVMTQVQVGYWKDSMTLFTHALKVTEKNYLAHNNLGRTLAGLGKFSEAVHHYHEANRIDPFYMPAFYNLGVARMKQGRLEEAMTAFSEALKIRPGDGDVHFGRGEVYALDGKWGEAIREYRAALKKKPADAALHNNLGVGLIHQDNLDEAIAEFREAIRLDPEHAGAHCNMGMLLMARGQIDGAIRHFREAITIEPNFANAHYQLALSLRSKNLLDEAAFHLAEAVRINPAILIMKGKNGAERTPRPVDRGGR
jgi:tetratricopeptide (TPR) repeat protein